MKQNIPSAIIKLCVQLRQQGAQAWLVGGAVRDLLWQGTVKDFDLEVFGIEEETLQNSLRQLAYVRHIGRHFPVYQIHYQGFDIEIALPRRERKTAAGHTGFCTEVNPHLAPEQASLRRDFTINAMMFEPLTGQLLDFHQGQDDLKRHTLKHVSAAFQEDPLRVLRGMQMAARFALTLADETATYCQSMIDEYPSLAKERIWQEWQKWSHSEHPSYGLKVLQASTWLGLYPELAALTDCQQDPHRHPEGTVWTHSCMAVDAAARIATRENLNPENREILLFSALCHDLGKAECSFSDTADIIRSPGHEAASVAPALRFLQSIHAPQYIQAAAAPLIKYHLQHLHAACNARNIRRLSHQLEPSNIQMWEHLVEADASARHPNPICRPAQAWLHYAQDMRLEQAKPKALLTGKVLLKEGLSAGPEMGNILKKAYQAQLNGDFQNLESALQWYRHSRHSV